MTSNYNFGKFTNPAQEQAENITGKAGQQAQNAQQEGISGMNQTKPRDISSKGDEMTGEDLQSGEQEAEDTGRRPSGKYAYVFDQLSHPEE